MYRLFFRQRKLFVCCFHREILLENSIRRFPFFFFYVHWPFFFSQNFYTISYIVCTIFVLKFEVSNRSSLKIKTNHFLRSRCVNFNWHIFTIMNIRYICIYMYVYMSFHIGRFFSIKISLKLSARIKRHRYNQIIYNLYIDGESTFETTFASSREERKREKKKRNNKDVERIFK